MVGRLCISILCAGPLAGLGCDAEEQTPVRPASSAANNIETSAFDTKAFKSKAEEVALALNLLNASPTELQSHAEQTIRSIELGTAIRELGEPEDAELQAVVKALEAARQKVDRTIAAKAEVDAARTRVETAEFVVRTLQSQRQMESNVSPFATADEREASGRLNTARSDLLVPLTALSGSEIVAKAEVDRVLELIQQLP
jgi:hypothetical protein